MLPGESVVQDPAHSPGGAAGGVPTHVWTACTNPSCKACGVRRQIWLKQASVGVIAVPAYLCAACGDVLPVVLWPDNEEMDMPKLHADRPPTSKADIPTEPEVVTTVSVAAADLDPTATDTRAAGGVVENPPVAGEDGPGPAETKPAKKTAPRRGRANAKPGEASGA